MGQKFRSETCSCRSVGVQCRSARGKFRSMSKKLTVLSVLKGCWGIM